MMWRWEVWALWAALFTGVGVLGYTAWTWPATAARPVATAVPATELPAPRPRAVPWPETSALLADEASSSLSLVGVAGMALAEPAPALVQRAGEALTFGMKSHPWLDALVAVPEVVDLRPQAWRATAAAPNAGQGPAVPESSVEVDLPAFPVALPVPAPFTR